MAWTCSRDAKHCKHCSVDQHPHQMCLACKVFLLVFFEFKSKLPPVDPDVSAICHSKSVYTCIYYITVFIYTIMNCKLCCTCR